MLSSVLDSYIDDDDEAEGEGGPSFRSSSGATSASDAAAAASSTAIADTDPPAAISDSVTRVTVKTEISALSGFASPPRKKRIDLLRLQMCCPTIVGASVDSEADSSRKEQRFSAHTLFSFPLPRGKLCETGQSSAHRLPVALSPTLPATDHTASSSNSSPQKSTNGAYSPQRHISGGWRAKPEVTENSTLSPTASVATKDTCTADGTPPEESAVSAGSTFHATTGRTSTRRASEVVVDARDASSTTRERTEEVEDKRSAARAGERTENAEGKGSGVRGSRERAAHAGDEGTSGRAEETIQHPGDKGSAGRAGERAENAVDKGSTALGGAGAVIGPDGIPVLKYEQGVFRLAEVAPMKEYGGRRKQVQQQNSTGLDELRRATGGIDGHEGRGKRLLRMLPKPQHQQQVLGPSVQGLQQHRGGHQSKEHPSFSLSANHAPSTNVEEANENLNVSRHQNTSSSADTHTRTSSARHTSGSDVAAEVERKEGEETGSEALDEGRGSLFSLFSAYDDDDEAEKSDSVVKTEERAETETTNTTRRGKRRRSATVKDEDTSLESIKLPLLGIPVSVDTKKEEDPNTESTTMSRIGVTLQPSQNTYINHGAESTASVENTENPEPVTGTYVDIWRSNVETGESAAAALSSAAAHQWNSNSAQQTKIEGMSLNEVNIRIFSGE